MLKIFWRKNIGATRTKAVQVVSKAGQLAFYAAYITWPWEMSLYAAGRQIQLYQQTKAHSGHIEEGYRKNGLNAREAEKRAWATLNKEDKGGKKEAAVKVH